VRTVGSELGGLALEQTRAGVEPLFLESPCRSPERELAGPHGHGIIDGVGQSLLLPELPEEAVPQESRHYRQSRW